MFAPIGYVPYEAVLESINHLTHSALIRITGASLADKSERGNIAELMVNSGIVSDIKNAQFVREFIEEYFLATLISSYPPLLCSPAGVIMQVNDSFFIHGDRLDWFNLYFPIDRMGELSSYLEFSKKNRFDGASLRRRYCFIDAENGLVKLKNNSVRLFNSFSDGGTGEGAELAALVEKFSGWAICWNESDLPTSLELVNTVFPDFDGRWKWDEFFGETEDRNEASDGLPKDSLAVLKKAPGRPALVPDVARILLAEFNNERGDLSGKALTEQVSLSLGKIVAVKTVQRAVRFNSGSDKISDLSDAT